MPLLLWRTCSRVTNTPKLSVEVAGSGYCISKNLQVAVANAFNAVLGQHRILVKRLEVAACGTAYGLSPVGHTLHVGGSAALHPHQPAPSAYVAAADAAVNRQ
jgi:hypothetical protein